jgi:hypothetical protein
LGNLAGVKPTEMRRIGQSWPLVRTADLIRSGACRSAMPGRVDKPGIDTDRVKFKRTVRIVPRRAADPAAFPP